MSQTCQHRLGVYSALSCGWDGLRGKIVGTIITLLQKGEVLALEKYTIFQLRGQQWHIGITQVGLA